MQIPVTEINKFTFESLATQEKSFHSKLQKEPVSICHTDRLAQLFELFPQVDRFEMMGKKALRSGFRGEMMGIGRLAVVGRSEKADFGGFAMRAFLVAIAKMARTIEHLMAAGQNGQNERFAAEIADMERRKSEIENLIRCVVLREGKSTKRRDINGMIFKTNLFSLCENSLRELADLWPREYREAMESFERSAKRNAQLLAELGWLCSYGEPLMELSKKFVGKEFRDLAMMKLGFMISQSVMTKEAFDGGARECGVDGALRIAHAFAPDNMDLAQVVKLRDKLAAHAGLAEIKFDLSVPSCLELVTANIVKAGEDPRMSYPC